MRNAGAGQAPASLRILRQVDLERANTDIPSARLGVDGIGTGFVLRVSQGDLAETDILEQGLPTGSEWKNLDLDAFALGTSDSPVVDTFRCERSDRKVPPYSHFLGTRPEGDGAHRLGVSDGDRSAGLVVFHFDNQHGKNNKDGGSDDGESGKSTQRALLCF